MKIYTEYNTESDSVEILFTHHELKAWVDALIKFESKIEQYKKEQKGNSDLGFTHLHFKDCGSIGKNSKTDVVIYVDLDEAGS